MMAPGRNIVVEASRGAGAPDGAVEMCEHKGAGHPDTLTDGACEAAARALAAAYRQAAGRVLHFNLDKGLLVAGASVPRFGGGRVVEPIKLIICGRATECGPPFDPRAIIDAAVDGFLRRTVPAARVHFRVLPEIRAGSASLAGIYAAGHAVAIANDTSFGVGYAPLSPLEQQVSGTAALLRSDAFRARFPAAGADFKIMGLRTGARARLTVALALVDRHVGSVAHYFEIKAAIAAELSSALPRGTVVALNCLDRPDAVDESGLHLTVTGLSAEMGDDGQVGRGNRVNGLITPGRPMSLEAVAGKNPVSHVGKLYNVLADAIARDIVQRVDGIAQVEVKLLSTIGAPVDQPQMALVEAGPAVALTPARKQEIARLVDSWFERIDTVTARLESGLATVY
ncbi:MAG TPA: methionine adenosyltransferase [Burkholderiaceae bacterium]|nr:methionine adenosyltransferase [Burkholderiaceae bacterium]